MQEAAAPLSRKNSGERISCSLLVATERHICHPLRTASPGTGSVARWEERIVEVGRNPSFLFRLPPTETGRHGIPNAGTELGMNFRLYRVIFVSLASELSQRTRNSFGIIRRLTKVLVMSERGVKFPMESLPEIPVCTGDEEESQEISTSMQRCRSRVVCATVAPIKSIHPSPRSPRL